MIVSIKNLALESENSGRFMNFKFVCKFRYV